jgi:hypothetical protein
MPCYKSQGVNGDLFIRFNLVLPKVISDNNLEQLKLIFKDDPLFLENKLQTQFDKEVFLENVSEADLEDLDNIYSDDETSESSGESEESEDSEDSEELSETSESSEELVVKKISLNKK